MCGKGQIHTLEAVIASAIILTTLFIAMSIPNPKSGLSEFRTLQLKKYADDILTLLTIENSSGVSTLYIYIYNNDCSGLENYFEGNISEPLFNNLSLGTNLTIYNVSENYNVFCRAGYPIPEYKDVVSSFRVLIVKNSTYEVRLYVWFV